MSWLEAPLALWALIVPSLVVLALWGLYLLTRGLANAAGKPAPTPRVIQERITATTVTGTVAVTPDMAARLQGIHGPEDQKAAMREVTDMVEWEKEWVS